MCSYEEEGIKKKKGDHALDTKGDNYIYIADSR